MLISSIFWTWVYSGIGISARVWIYRQFWLLDWTMNIHYSKNLWHYTSYFKGCSSRWQFRLQINQNPISRWWQFRDPIHLRGCWLTWTMFYIFCREKYPRASFAIFFWRSLQRPKFMNLQQFRVKFSWNQITGKALQRCRRLTSSSYRSTASFKWSAHHLQLLSHLQFKHPAACWISCV